MEIRSLTDVGLPDIASGLLDVRELRNMDMVTYFSYLIRHSGLFGITVIFFY